MSRLAQSVRTLVASVGVAAAAACAAAPAAHAVEGPPQKSLLVAGAYGVQHGGGKLDPPGSNDWSCKPTAAHPRPVILVHGTWANAYNDWAYMSPKLKATGVCVFALNYSASPAGINGSGPVRRSAQELGVYVDKVLAATGASQVDLVGHSLGGMMPRAYLKWYGGADAADPSKNKVHSLVTIGASHLGAGRDGVKRAKTIWSDLLEVGVSKLLGQAAIDQRAGSPFLKELNAGGLTTKGVRYTAIATQYDTIISPWRNAHLVDNPAGAEVHNITLQGSCLTNWADHLSMNYSARTLWYVKFGLGLPRTKIPTCDIQLPVI